jgi:hypothetical protein
VTPCNKTMGTPAVSPCSKITCPISVSSGTRNECYPKSVPCELPSSTSNVHFSYIQCSYKRVVIGIEDIIGLKAILIQIASKLLKNSYYIRRMGHSSNSNLVAGIRSFLRRLTKGRVKKDAHQGRHQKCYRI